MMRKPLSSLDLKPHGWTLWIRPLGFTQVALNQAFVLYGLLWTLIFSLKLNIFARNACQYARAELLLMQFAGC